jgi:DNA-binding transcriptional ArsR family regulator
MLIVWFFYFQKLFIQKSSLHSKFHWQTKIALEIKGQNIFRIISPSLENIIHILLGFKKSTLRIHEKIFKAITHPSWVLIIEELTDGERCVCDLTEKIDADISTVSKHLSVMKNAGLVIDEKRANQVFYRLRVPCILKFFDCVETVLEDLKNE